MAHRMKLKHLLAYATVCIFSLLVFFGSACGEGYVLPDTGQTKCYGNSGEISCPNLDQPFYGQDASYNNPIDQPSYTKLDANGNALLEDATSWVMVRDERTGLIWEKADGGLNMIWDDALAHCAGSDLGNYSDWRLPSRMELLSLLDYGGSAPAIATAFFEGRSCSYWSETADINSDYLAWHVLFFNGDSGNFYKNSKYAVRCVRGESPEHQPFIKNNDGTLTDPNTGLTWQETDDGRRLKWEDALSYCEALDLANYHDWRLPNIRELLSLVDDSLREPAADPDLSIQPGFYCSSSTIASHPFQSWHVHFGYGYPNHCSKNSNDYVRCVRGPFEDPQSPALNITSHTDNQQVTSASITLAGTATDSETGNNGIKEVTVNGVRASDDTAVGTGTANWSKEITLQVGINRIVVAAYDNVSPPNPTTKTITLFFPPGNSGMLMLLMSEE